MAKKPVAQKQVTTAAADAPAVNGSQAQTALAAVDSWLTLGGKLAPVVFAVIGLGYLAGYVIVNLYLNLLNVRPPNLVTSRYLATGVLYLFTIAIPITPIVIGMRALAGVRDTWSKWQSRLARWGAQ